MSRKDDARQQSANALDAAEDARTEAVRIYGPDSPEALVADEQAFDAYQRHFGNPS